MNQRDPSAPPPALPQAHQRRATSGILPLGDFQRRLELLHQRRLTPPDGPPHPTALEDLEAACEELHVADEELRAQQEQIAETSQQLEQQQQRYRDLFDLAPEPYLITDRAGRIVQANGAAGELLGPHLGPLDGRFLALFVSLRDRPRLRARLGQMAVGKPTERWECTLATVPARAVAITLRADTTGALLWALRETTEQRRQQALLQSMNEELERRVRERTEELEAARATSEELFVRERQARQRLEAAGRDRAEPAWLNLLAGVLASTPPGGAVEVRIEREAAHAVVSVQDPDSALTADQLARLLEVEAHGGTVEASGPGEGIVVRLPLGAANQDRDGAPRP